MIEDLESTSETVTPLAAALWLGPGRLVAAVVGALLAVSTVFVVQGAEMGVARATSSPFVVFVSPRTTAVPTVAATLPSRPSDLPLLPGEETLVRRFAEIGVTAEGIGYSMFDRALGSAVPARVFVLSPRDGEPLVQGRRGSADVLFLDEVHRDLRVCATASPQGLVYRIFADGREASTVSEGRLVTFLADAQHFIIAWDERAAGMFEFAVPDLVRLAC